MAVDVATFSWLDYLIFSLTLVLSAFIGVFWSVRTRQKIQKSAYHHLNGDRKLQIFPVAMSLSASFLSAVFIIGSPTEVYVNGGMFVYIIVSYLTVTLATSVFFIPIFHKLKLTSAYEYLERRFNKRVRLLGSLTFTLEMIVYLGVVTYTPSLALSQVTGLSMEVCILAVGIICTFYTAIGGIKAVVWTDVLQLAIIVSGLVALVIQGTIDAGGWTAVVEKVTEGHRMPYLDFNLDPLASKNTFWTLNIGGFFTFMTVYGSNQAALQRYSSVRTLRGAQAVMWLALPIGIVNLLMLCAVGFVMYAKYADCDPFLSGRIAKLDQIVPLFMIDTLGVVPGLSGLFTSCIFSASLSTISSGVNSLAAVTICDFITPVLSGYSTWKASPRFISILTIVCSLVYGSVAIAFAYLAGTVGKTVLRIGMSTFGMLGGPLLGLFICGILLPFVNSYGAGIGMVCSLMTSLWLGIGSAVNPVRRDILPLSMSGCLMSTDNTSMVYDTMVNATGFYETVTNATASVITMADESSVMEKIYGMSYFHYATVAVLVSVVVSTVVSVCTGCNKEAVDRDLYVDIWGFVRKIMCTEGCHVSPRQSSFTEASPHPYALVYMATKPENDFEKNENEYKSDETFNLN